MTIPTFRLTWTTTRTYAITVNAEDENHVLNSWLTTPASEYERDDTVLHAERAITTIVRYPNPSQYWTMDTIADHIQALLHSLIFDAKRRPR